MSLFFFVPISLANIVVFSPKLAGNITFNVFLICWS